MYGHDVTEVATDFFFYILKYIRVKWNIEKEKNVELGLGSMYQLLIGWRQI